MTLRSLTAFIRGRVRRTGGRRPARPRVRIGVEALENRCVPATFHVTTLVDGATGSLRDEIAQANLTAGHNDIVFDVTGTHYLSMGELLITNGDLTINTTGQTEVVDAQMLSRVFEIMANNAKTTTFIGLTITHGLATDNGGTSGDGGGIHVSGGNLTLSGTTVSYNTAGRDGGGIALDELSGGQLQLVQNTVVDHNTAAHKGGGVSAVEYDTANVPGMITVDQSTISNNTAADLNSTQSDGGGIYQGVDCGLGPAGPTPPSMPYLTVQNQSMITNNHAGRNGGGFFSEANVTVDASTIANNDTAVNNPFGSGGGFYIGFSTESFIPTVEVGDNSLITDNYTGGDGGGFYSSADLGNGITMIVGGTTIQNNTAVYDGGGFFSQANTTVSHSTIQNNHANRFGGGFEANTPGSAYDPTLSVDNTLIADNRANQDGGGFITYISTTIASTTIQQNYAGQPSIAGGNGGGGSVGGANSLSITSTTFDSNQAIGIGSQGGGLFAGASATIITASTFSRNTASQGGGLWDSVSGTPADPGAIITANTFSGNTVTGTGGGIFFQSVSGAFVSGGIAVVTNSTFSGNTANAADGGGGGGIAAQLVRNSGQYGLAITFNFCTIAFNQTNGRGGGIYAIFPMNPTGPSVIQLHNTILAKNTATTSGNDGFGSNMSDYSSLDYNLIGDTDGMNITLQPHDQSGVDPQLDPLGNYGGPTQTHRIHQTSPAFQHALTDPNVPTDQRGDPRNDMGTGDPPDVGAFEWQPSDGHPEETGAAAGGLVLPGRSVLRARAAAVRDTVFVQALRHTAATDDPARVVHPTGAPPGARTNTGADSDMALNTSPDDTSTPGPTAPSRLAGKPSPPLAWSFADPTVSPLVDALQELS